MRTIASYFRSSLAALRLLAVFTVILGVGYPLAVTAIAQLPGLRSHADGSLIHQASTVLGSRLLGQAFTDSSGNPLPQYFQSRPSAAGAGYDPTASSASNLGPESIVDTLANPGDATDQGKPSLLTQVCARSVAIGKFDGVDGSRPFCTADGVGAVLAVFWSGPGYQGTVTHVVSVNQPCPLTPFVATYRGATVVCARYGVDYSHAQIVPVRGTAPDPSAVASDAVTASGSGLDPDISPSYAQIQVHRVAQARGVTDAQIQAVLHDVQRGRDLGFMGEPAVNVLMLNAELDAKYPFSSR